MEISGGNGGLHGALKNVRREDCWLIDIDSYYPSIMVEYNWLPRCRHPERFKELLMLKRSKMSEAKLMVNSVYGLLPEDMRLKICKKGQELMTALIERIGGELIQVNTDGIIVQNPNVRELNKWEESTGMRTKRSHIVRIIQKDVNNYMYLDDAGNITIKGTLRKQGIIGKAVASSLLHGTALADEIKRGALADYCMTRLADVYGYGQYYFVCDVVRYIHVTDDEGADLMIDGAKYPQCRVIMGALTDYTVDDYKIDYSYYLAAARDEYERFTGRKAK